MNSKEQKIKEAYGEYYEELKQHIDSNGWFNPFSKWENLSNYFPEQPIEEKSYFQRPKSLQGIENNNGWIKIESEDDLPMEDCRCEFIKDTGTQLYGRFENRMGGLFVDESRRFEHPEYRTESITHWKPIITSYGPLY